eukprot:COSAG01_NODE_2676_length_7264_cov_6.952128_2_plen_257_part_00
MMNPSPIYTDIHSHLYLCKEDPKVLLDRAEAAGVKQVINIAIDLGSSRKVLAMYQRDKRALATVGIHPCESKDFDKIATLETLIKDQRQEIVAIAEIGLDYYWQDDNKAAQEDAFRAQLDLAQRYNLPVIIHNRKADEDMIRVTKDFPNVTKVFHCFMGGPSLVEQLMQPNHYFSFTGSITYAKKGKTIQAIKALPMDRMFIETDCPYLTPKAYQGQPNQPLYVLEVAKKIADVKGLDIIECAELYNRNFLKLFDK